MLGTRTKKSCAHKYVDMSDLPMEQNQIFRDGGLQESIVLGQ